MSPTLPTEGQLVRALQNHQPAAFTTLYTAYSPALLVVLLPMNPDRAKDLHQDAFIKIWINIQHYNPEKGRLFTWMVAIAQHVTLGHFRAQKVRIAAVPYLLSKTSDRTNSERHEGLFNQPVLSLLAPQYSQIIELVYQGYSREEIAASFKLPLGTVKTRFRTGLLKLKKLLTQDIHHYHGG